MTQTVWIGGAGVAGLTTARLLARHGWTVELRGSRDGPPYPWVLNPIAIALYKGIWGIDLRSLPTARVLAGRTVVKLGSYVQTAEPLVLVRGRDVLSALWARVGHKVRWGEVQRGADLGRALADAPEGDWIVDASGRGAWVCRARGWGAPYQMGSEACWFGEASWSLASDRAVYLGRHGTWCFGVPMGNGRAWIQVMLPNDFDGGLEIANGLTRELDASVETWTRVPAHAAMLDPLFGDRWLAVGDAALAMNPVAGDGNGSALRQAHWAAKLLTVNEPRLFEQYAARLRTMFASHLVAAQQVAEVVVPRHRVYGSTGLDASRESE